MIGYLPFVAWFALLVYCILDVDRTPPDATRVLPGHWWFVVVVTLPIAGAVAWLAWGRPTSRAVADPPAAAAGVVGSLARGAGPATLPAPLLDTSAESDISLRVEFDRIDREFEELVRRSRERHRRGPPQNPSAAPSGQ